MINVANWAQFLIETGDYNVTYVREDPTAINPVGHPELYRYQLQGPTAIDILTKVNGGVRPELAFFTAGEFRVGDHHVRGLGHGMTRSGGMEITGPWAESAAVRELLLEAGEEFGLVPNGSRAPTPGALESGWFGTPLPAVYTGESTRAFRKWLPADSFEATGSLGGSYISDDMTDYYLTPQDLGYGRLVKFDHDFIGRDALERGLAGPKRRKVTLAWNSKDVLGVIATAFEQGDPAKWMEFPFSTYSTWPYDAVHSGDRTVGFSAFSGYTYNERKVLSLAVVEDGVEEGSEVTVVWGEPDGGSSRPIVERHVQTEIRATVSRVPFSNIDEK
jgi:vanillate/3-O-methylgallate O-demethylase